MNKKIEKWLQDVDELSTYAINEPQIALAAYTKALSKRWCFVQRTIAEIGELFQPVENIIRDKLIPAIVGRKVSDLERRMLALPVKYGGIGIQNPVETADIEYEASVKITTNLKSIIFNQERNLENLDENMVKNIINQVKQDKDKRLAQELEKAAKAAEEEKTAAAKAAEQKETLTH